MLSVSFFQLTDSFWKPPLNTEVEGKTRAAKGKGEASAAAEAADDEDDVANEESSEEAAAAENDSEAEESSPEAPTADAAERESAPEAPTTDVVEEESSSEALYADEEHTESSPAGAQPTLSAESSEAKSRSSTPPTPTNGSRVAVSKVPASRVQGASSSPSETEEIAQRVLAAKKRKLRSEGPAETPLPLPVSHKRKSTSSPEKADSYESGMSMPSSDSQASLDLETNIGYDFLLYLY